MSNNDNRGNTLSLPAGAARHERSGNRNNFRNSEHKPRVAKGHDAQLKDAQDNGKPVQVVTMAGETIKGNISNRDRYTITIRNGNQYSIYYKHSIESITIIQPEVAA